MQSNVLTLPKEPQMTNQIPPAAPPVDRHMAQYDKITSKVERITPDQAAIWLTHHNPRNRHLVPHLVDDYARQMKAGLWMMNGVPVEFDLNGNLLDGQHRLAAVVKSGCPADLTITRGLDPDSFKTIDIGKRRSHKDHLHIEGVKSNDLGSLAAAARIVRNFDPLTGIYHHNRVSMNPQELIDFVNQHPHLDTIIAGLPGNTKRVVSRAIAGAMKYQFWRIHEGKADAFMDALISGAGLQEGSPILALRNRLVNMLMDGTPLGASSVRRQIVAYFVFSWRAYQEGRTLATLLYRTEYEISLPELT